MVGIAGRVPDIPSNLASFFGDAEVVERILDIVLDARADLTDLRPNLLRVDLAGDHVGFGRTGHRRDGKGAPSSALLYWPLKVAMM